MKNKALLPTYIPTNQKTISYERINDTMRNNV